jgi:2'-5' RNA ligase
MSRLFFALWPDELTRTQMAQLQTHILPEYQQHAIPTENFHFSLFFLGEIDNTTREAMTKAAASVRVPRFELQFEQCGYWKHSRILHLDLQQYPPELEQLVKDLSAVLKPLGYVSDHPDFKAHVTLARKVILHHPSWPAFETIHWPVNDFVLVSSQQNHHGSIYTIEERFLLL